MEESNQSISTLGPISDASTFVDSIGEVSLPESGSGKTWPAFRQAFERQFWWGSRREVERRSMQTF